MKLILLRISAGFPSITWQANRQPPFSFLRLREGTMPGNSSLKLFVDGHVFDQEYQGSRTYLKELYLELTKREDIDFYFGSHNSDKLRAVFPRRDNIRLISYDQRSSLMRLLVNLPTLLERHRIDLAHFQYVVPPIKKCRYLVTIHDMIFNDFPGEFSYRYRLTKNILYGHGARKADLLTTVSAFSKNSICKNLGMTGEKVHVIPNAVGDLFFNSPDKEISKLRLRENYGLGKFILYVSRFEPRKNHVTVLRSFIELELYRRGYQLVFLGHESLPCRELDSLLSSLDTTVREKILVRQNVDDEALLHFYNACSLFVYPSRAEGFGIPPLEAAATNTPVICSNASAMADFDFFGENHIDPCGQHLWNQRILSSLDNPPSAVSLNSIRETIRCRYSWKASADKLYALIRETSFQQNQKQKHHDQLPVA